MFSRTRAIAAALQSAYFETDEHGEVTYINDSYTTLTGLSHTDAMRGRLKEVLSSEDDQRLQAAFRQGIEHQEIILARFTITHPTTGTVTNATLRAYPIFNDAGFAGHAGTIVAA